MDSKKRTLLKTAIYRGSTTGMLFILSWLFTNDIYETSIITIVFNILATGIYYFHERFWSRTNWGTIHQSTNKANVVA